MMIKDNRYPRGFAGAITAAASVVGPIFPPSIPMVWFALISSSSVGALFLGGVVPALMIVAHPGHRRSGLHRQEARLPGRGSDPVAQVPAHPRSAPARRC